MTESIITISVAGLLAGIIFSMPIAGPISILITTNALKGRMPYCNRVNLGASFGTFTYVFFAVYGLTKLYPYYKPAVPYLFCFCCLFLLFLGLKIFRTKLDIEHIEDKSHITEKVKKIGKGGFYTGCMINFLNPTLFIGWLTSTFLVISFVSSLGFNTGGLDIYVNESVKEISNLNSSATDDLKELSAGNNETDSNIEKNNTSKDNFKRFPKHFHLFISLLYAIFITAGSLAWFYFLVYIIGRFRKNINIKFLTLFVKGLGIVLCFFGIYFGYLASEMLFNLKI
jgi:threonine/homoserine/homoserine lactone efflux protein